MEAAEGLTFALDDVAIPIKMAEADARAVCIKLKDTAVVKACLIKFPTIDVDAYVADCIEDVIETADPSRSFATAPCPFCLGC